MEIQFTRTRSDFFTIDIESDAVTALLDAHGVGDPNESVSDRLATADDFGIDDFWSALADQAGAHIVDTETNWTLDGDDADEDEEDDEDDDDEQDDEDDDTVDLGSLLIDA